MTICKLINVSEFDLSKVTFELSLRGNDGKFVGIDINGNLKTDPKNEPEKVTMIKPSDSLIIIPYYLEDSKKYRIVLMSGKTNDTDISYKIKIPNWGGDEAKPIESINSIHITTQVNNILANLVNKIKEIKCIDHTKVDYTKMLNNIKFVNGHKSFMNGKFVENMFSKKNKITELELSMFFKKIFISNAIVSYDVKIIQASVKGTIVNDDSSLFLTDKQTKSSSEEVEKTMKKFVKLEDVLSSNENLMYFKDNIKKSEKTELNDEILIKKIKSKTNKSTIEI
jgi:hypothetical protein